MNREEFLEKFTDALQTEEILDNSVFLDDLEEWDSLSKMATMVLFDKELGIKITFEDIKSFATVEDVLKKAGLN